MNAPWGSFFPGSWEEFVAAAGDTHPEHAHMASKQLIFGADEDAARRAAVAMCRYELRCCFLEPDEATIGAQLDPDACLATARIRIHYGNQRLPLSPGQLLDGLDAVRHIPCTVIQARCDIVTPLSSAFLLQAAWPELKLIMPPVAGHMPSDSGNVIVMTDLFDRLVGAA
jgi:proline iminopeptidase